MSSDDDLMTLEHVIAMYDGLPNTEPTIVLAAPVSGIP
jgi:hypothetical protein